MNTLTEKQKLLLKRLRDGEKLLRRIRPLGEETTLPGRGGPIRALIYHPPEAKGPLPVFFDLHGGGFAHGLPEWDDRFCSELAGRTGMLVLSVDYRLAPEFPFPTGLNDVYDAISYVHSHPDAFGTDPERMAAGGHSSGGNLTTAVCMLAKKTGAFRLRCQVLDYPPLNLNDTEGRSGQAGSVDPEVVGLYNACYCEPRDLRENPLVSPLIASPEELAGLPPALILAAGLDTLRGGARQYADNLTRAGVPAEYVEYENMPHGFTIAAYSPLVRPGRTDSRRQAVQRAGNEALAKISDTLCRLMPEA